VRTGSLRLGSLATWAVLVFLLAPLVVIVAASVGAGGYLTFPPQGFSLKWYAKAVTTEGFVRGFRVSFLVGLAAAAGAAVLGVGAAVAITRHRFPGKAAVEGVLLAPLVVPHIVTGIALLGLFTTLRAPYSLWRLILAHLIITVPYVVRTVAAGLHDQDPCLEEASLNLGRTHLQTFLHVTLPLILPCLLAGSIFAFIISFENYIISVFLAGPSYATLPMELYGYMQYITDPALAALSTMLLAITVGLMLALDRLFGIDRLTLFR